MRRVLCATIIAVLPWLLAPGRVQPDTKADLTLAPWAYLARALWAWNDHSGWGELQNQAYGYLFPMGSFMGLVGEVLPAWAVQRTWWSLLLVVAFVGAERLARRLGAADGGAALVAGFAYALSSRIITVLPEISVEAWPMALAPWLVLAAMPLVDGISRGRERVHAVAATGLLTATLGGVNATASLVVLGLPALYLLTAPAGRRVATGFFGWCVGVMVGAFWWIVPLLLLGRYAYPFLDHIESASMTNAVTSLPNVLRGASHWVAYIINATMHPVWQSGWFQAQSVVAIVAGCLVMGGGLVGLVLWRRRVQENGAHHAIRFALASLLIGLLCLTLGYSGFAGSPLAEPVQSFLDGPGAPLRNIHKADPLVRLPLVLGLAVLVSHLGSVRRDQVIALVALIALVVSPVAWWSGRGGDAWSYEAVPNVWSDVATTIDDLAARSGGATLLLPGSRTAHYEWGRPNDEPLSAWAESAVVVRNSAPLGHIGAWQAFDRLELLASSGLEQPHLADAYARFGIARVVVRRTLDDSTEAEPYAAVEATLTASPGFTRLSENSELSLWTIDGFDSRVAGFSTVTSTAADADGMAELVARGLVDSNTALIVDEKNPQWATDASREQVYNNGLPSHAARGATRSESTTGRATRAIVGLHSVTVSSSAADPFKRGQLGAGASEWSAFDGDDETAWISARERQSTLTIEFDGPRSGELTIDVVSRRGVLGESALDVSTDGARQSVPVIDGRATVTVTSATRVGIGFTDVGRPVQRGISEIRLDDEPFGVLTRLDAVIGEQSILLTRDPRDRPDPERRGEEGAGLVWQLTSAVSGAVPATVTSTTEHGATVSREVSFDVDQGPVHIGVSDPPGERVRSVVIDPPQQRAPQTTSLTARRVSSGHHHVTIPADSNLRLIALTESANAGWQAKLGDRVLESVTVDGWRQGFMIPQGAHGLVQIEFTPNGWHRSGLAVGGVLVLLLFMVFLATRDSRSMTEPMVGPIVEPVVEQEPRRVPPWLLNAGVLAVPTLIGGLWGLGAAAASFLVPRRHADLAIMTAALMAGVGLAFFGVVAHDSMGAIVGQLAALAALSLTLRALVLAREPSE